VKSRIARGVEKLRKLLGNSEYELSRTVFLTNNSWADSRCMPPVNKLRNKWVVGNI
jgi:hypothetical protein